MHAKYVNNTWHAVIMVDRNDFKIILISSFLTFYYFRLLINCVQKNIFTSSQTAMKRRKMKESPWYMRHRDIAPCYASHHRGPSQFVCWCVKMTIVARAFNYFLIIFVTKSAVCYYRCIKCSMNGQQVGGSPEYTDEHPIRSINWLLTLLWIIKSISSANTASDFLSVQFVFVKNNKKSIAMAFIQVGRISTYPLSCECSGRWFVVYMQAFLWHVNGSRGLHWLPALQMQ